MASSNIRICFVEIPGALERAIPKGCDDRGCYFRGVAGPAFSMMTNDIMWQKERFNATVKFYDSFGVREPDGSYSGCLGSMVRNETDISAAIMNYPCKLSDYLLTFKKSLIGSLSHLRSR